MLVRSLARLLESVGVDVFAKFSSENGYIMYA